MFHFLRAKTLAGGSVATTIIIIKYLALCHFPRVYYCN